MTASQAGPPPADQIPDVPILQALGDRRSIRYFDADRDGRGLEDRGDAPGGPLRLVPGQHQLPPRRSSSARTRCELWDELEECVSGFNVQIINQASHLILWLTNLNAWYGRGGGRDLDASPSPARLSKYHGWNYEFSMTQTIPRLMSFPTERTEILLRFESGQAAANAIAAGVGLGVGNILIAFGRKPGGIEKAFGLPPHYRFTWGHAVGYPLENANAGGQRPRLKFEKLFHDNAFGVPLTSDPATVEMLRGEGAHPGAGAAARPHRGDRRASPRSTAATRGCSTSRPARSAACWTTTTGTSAPTCARTPSTSWPPRTCRTTPTRCATTFRS